MTSHLSLGPGTRRVEGLNEGIFMSVALLNHVEPCSLGEKMTIASQVNRLGVGESGWEMGPAGECGGLREFCVHHDWENKSNNTFFWKPV